MEKAESRIVEEAKTWIGTRMRSFCAGKGSGTDCLGFIVCSYASVYPEFGDGRIPPPGYMRWRSTDSSFEKLDVIAAEYGLESQDLEGELRVADIVFLKRGNRIQSAMYMGEGEFIFATLNGGVHVEKREGSLNNLRRVYRKVR